ncbi:unnamed protein product [Pedinophyceae sp. YPF-701]|nr:unnamed protein product [Pedinophyceae sp. YPF-701]
MYRDFEQEAEFIVEAYRSRRGQNAPKSLLDVGCGPGGHAVEVAKRGLSVTGLDICQEMLDYAGEKAREAGVDVALVQGDMRSFPPPPGAPFDIVVTMLGTMMHLTEVLDAKAFFQCVAAAMAPDGVFIVELSHPGDIFDGSLTSPEALAADRWDCEEHGRRVQVQWGSPYDRFDDIRQVLHRRVQISMSGADVADDSYDEVVQQRFYTVGELALLADAAGMEVEALFGETNVESALNDHDAYRCLAMLRRKQ